MKENLFKKFQNLFNNGEKVAKNLPDTQTSDIYEDDAYIDDLLNSEESVRLTSLSLPSQTIYDK